jgi:hypothetical protein
MKLDFVVSRYTSLSPLKISGAILGPPSRNWAGFDRLSALPLQPVKSYVTQEYHGKNLAWGTVAILALAHIGVKVNQNATGPERSWPWRSSVIGDGTA